MGRFIDLTGMRFGKLVVVSRADGYISPTGSQFQHWNCECDCGGKSVVRGCHLRSGHTKSCGCFQRQRASETLRKANEYRIEGNIVFVKLSNSDQEMIADKDTWERAKGYCWYLSDTGYAVTKGKKMMSFHSFAFSECPSGMVRDHINGDRLDNRKSNIRFVTIQQNNQNHGKGKLNLSGHTGVSFEKRRRKWAASITMDRRKLHLGYFSNLQDAIAAREAAEIKYFGEYRRKK